MWNSFFYSFPIQLLLLHLKKNLVLVGIWVLLLLIILEEFGKVLGIPYLFLDPEYLNDVSWMGFFLMGIGFAVFTMAFHMTTYIMDGAKFKFLAILSRPFLRFCINNSIIPMIVYVVYFVSVILFQLENYDFNTWGIVKYFMGFLVGNALTFWIFFYYFSFTNKDFFVLFTDTVDKQLRKSKLPRANVIKRYKDRKRTSDKVLTYLDINLKPRVIRHDLDRFEGNKLLKVFDQNHLNLFIIEVVLVFIILFLGFFRDYEFLQFPAAMSVMLIFSILTLLIGAVIFWMRSWSVFVALSVFLVINWGSQTRLMNRPHSALGLNYDNPPAVYDLDHLEDLLHPDTIRKDKAKTLEILNNWKSRFPEEHKPKILLLACSGGGQRAALWTLHVMQQLHISSKGKFMENTRMITGASGGVIGAAFFRELYLRSQSDSTLDLTEEKYLEQIASDNLNSIIFTLMVNDLLIRNQTVEYNGREYLQDRGYAFENQLNINTKGVLDKPLKAYKEPEYQAKIPMLPITPLIVNDARKLFIAPHSMSYMGVSLLRHQGENEKSQAIDFMRFFRNHDAKNLRFISALRMGATFPFITPNIQLPSDPRMEIMDSGLSDNFGVMDALKFLYHFEDWISENTSGVVLVTIRDSEKTLEIEKKTPPTITQKLVTPLKNIYINWDNVQTLHNESLFNYFEEMLSIPVERVEFEYSAKDFYESQEEGLIPGNLTTSDPEIQRASLNWRLTAMEKRDIMESIYSAENQNSLKRIREIFSMDSR
ncbi:patatin-like phospholipase family protein [Echinicola jeungdonensis]|uniref:Patatin-like phospholipase family protein n=1 Tax=Echinicola jeungdonensis TaxID=709343 RepID=A0ABV5J2L9_9BACT|nr:patatin-like phospholipase family protein [Echinicola jeungdonensis]MDN3667944.1 patatin-like phospholipase family protein [Echinicola jeungdonensis]